MVHEQANLVFTIPFNLQESGDNKGTYPHLAELFTLDAENQTLPFPPPMTPSAITWLLEHIPLILKS